MDWCPALKTSQTDIKQPRPPNQRAQLEPTTMTAFKTITAAALLVIAAAAANNARPYQCETDTECEREAAARCWILCEL